MQLSLRLVIFPLTAREPVDSNRCGLLPKKLWTLVLYPVQRLVFSDSMNVARARINVAFAAAGGIFNDQTLGYFN
jgi:hypothetical protein